MNLVELNPDRILYPHVQTSSILTATEVYVSQAAACDGMIYSVHYNGQNSVTQGYAVPLFED